MHSRKQLANVIDLCIVDVAMAEEEQVIVKETIIEDYKRLNEKCDIIITKIKNRKIKKQVAG